MKFFNKIKDNNNTRLFTNAILTIRRQLGNYLTGVSHDGKRDIYDIYGYKVIRDFNVYFQAYRYQDIANRIVNTISRSCWRDGLSLVVKDKPVLEDDMAALNRQGLILQLEKADILNRIGRFSLLYIGIPGQDPEKPISKVTGKLAIEEVFFAPFAEDGINVNKWDTDITSSRYGMPILYTIQPKNRGEKDRDILVDAKTVHWSRVVVLSEGALDSGLEGISSLEPVLNRLDDLNKTIGGSAEAYFRNARGKIALEASPDFKSTLTPEMKKDLEEEVEAFTNGWQDFMRLAGITSKVLTTPQFDPTGAIRGALNAISGATGIPMRILTGEGAGQLAGNEDKASYNQLISDRQKQWCSGWILSALVILNKAGLFPDLPENVDVSWPINEVLNEKDKSMVNKQNSAALLNIAKAFEIESPVKHSVSMEQVMEQIFGFKYLPDLVDENLLIEVEEPDPKNKLNKDLPTT